MEDPNWKRFRYREKHLAVLLKCYTCVCVMSRGWF